MKYLRNSDIALRINLNPFNWVWVPAYAYDPPTAFMPNRKTFCVTWLFLQLFIDLYDGVVDIKAYNDAFINAFDMEVNEDESEYREVGSKVSPSSERSSILE